MRGSRRVSSIEEASDAIDDLGNEKAERLTSRGIVSGMCRLKHWELVELDTHDESAFVVLPPPSMQRFGATCAIVRTSTANVVQVSVGNVDGRVNGQVTITLPTTVGAYLFVATGNNWWGVV